MRDDDDDDFEDEDDEDDEDEDDDEDDDDEGALAQHFVDAVPPIKLNAKRPGALVDIAKALVAGRCNIVEFFEDGCPACQALGSRLLSLVEVNHDYALIRVDIDEFGSPVSRQFKIDEVPWLMIYDAAGQLLVKGDEADETLEDYLAANGIH